MAVNAVLLEQTLRSLKQSTVSAVQQTLSNHTAALRAVPKDRFTPFQLANEICQALAPVLATQLTAIRGNDTTQVPFSHAPINPNPQLTRSPTSTTPITPHVTPVHSTSTSYADAVRRDKRPSRVPSALRNIAAVLLAHRHPSVCTVPRSAMVSLLQKHLNVPFGLMTIHNATQRTHGYIIVLEQEGTEQLLSLSSRLFPAYQPHEGAAAHPPASTATSRYFYKTFSTYVPNNLDPKKAVIIVQEQLLQATAFELFVPSASAARQIAQTHSPFTIPPHRNTPESTSHPSPNEHGAQTNAEPAGQSPSHPLDTGETPTRTAPANRDRVLETTPHGERQTDTGQNLSPRAGANATDVENTTALEAQRRSTRLAAQARQTIDPTTHAISRQTD